MHKAVLQAQSMVNALAVLQSCQEDFVHVLFKEHQIA